MRLMDAMGLKRGEMAALIGAGGKTTTLFRLAREMREEGAKVLVTTTTKLYKPTKPHVDRLFLVQDLEALLAASRQMTGAGIIGAGYSIDEDGKLVGVPLAWFDSPDLSGKFDWTLIEADGAASRLFKVPSEHEPVVPANCHLTIWIMAIKVLGKPLHPVWVHRAERAAGLLGVPIETLVTVEHIVELVKHPLGCLKGVPHGSRKVALINQADSVADAENAQEVGRFLMELGFERAVITSYLASEPVKEIITH